MRRRFLASVAVLACLAMPAALLAPVAAGGATEHSTAAHATAVTFKGTIKCNIAGHISLSPAFTTTGTAPAKFVLTLKLTRCTGKAVKQHGVKIVGGTVKASGTASSNSCAAALSTLPPLTGSAHYRTLGGLARPTRFKFSGGNLAASNSGKVAVTYPGPTDTASSKGSFAGTKDAATGNVKQSFSQLVSACQTGLKSIGISSGSATIG